MPDPDEKRLTVRNRVKAAVSSDLSLTFLRTIGKAMRFKVSADDDYLGEHSQN